MLANPPQHGPYPTATVKDGVITCDQCGWTVPSTNYKLMDRHIEQAHS